jgi:hypothetical protein
MTGCIAQATIEVSTIDGRSSERLVVSAPLDVRGTSALAQRFAERLFRGASAAEPVRARSVRIGLKEASYRLEVLVPPRPRSTSWRIGDIRSSCAGSISSIASADASTEQITLPRHQWGVLVRELRFDRTSNEESCSWTVSLTELHGGASQPLEVDAPILTPDFFARQPVL